MAKKEDLPIVSGKTEELIHALQDSWSRWGWLFVVLNIVIAAVVIIDVLKRKK